jgi:D-lactate dehydrogenase
METVIFSTHKFENDYLIKANGNKHKLRLLDVRLNGDTAYLANGAKAVSIFVNDDASGPVLEKLKEAGVQFLVLRSAGFNHVNLEKAKELGIRVARVPAYSPYAVAEHTVALMLALNRKLIRANSRVHDSNFSLDGLTGFDMHGKTAGIIGTGKVGEVIARILYGFDCKILASDQVENEMLKDKFGVVYTDLETVFKQSDIITMHVPLTPETKYMINKETISKMKPGVMLINTSRGALINTKEVINGLKSRQIGYLGIDVYEEESGLFFEDHSDDVLQDDTISRLLTFNNVLITSHQAFLTNTALDNITATTVHNLDCFESGGTCENEL